jgi:hypothetical protein
MLCALRVLYQLSDCTCKMPKLDIVCLGVGAGATAVYDLDGGCSSSFLLTVDDVPVLLLDVVRWPPTFTILPAPTCMVA